MLVEQNARSALSIADSGIVLALGQVVMNAPAGQLLPSDAAEITAMLRQRIRQRTGRPIGKNHEEGLLGESTSITIRGRLLVAITADRGTEPWRLIRDDDF